MIFFFIFLLAIKNISGTFIPTPRLYGEWMLWHSTLPNIPTNRAVIHIYPDNHVLLSYRFNKGPFVFHSRKSGIYNVIDMDNNDQVKLNIDFVRTEEHFLSAYGIGVENMNIKTKDILFLKRYTLCMTLVGMDDIYLRTCNSERTNKNDNCFHLVRSVRVNEPSIDIPFSSFVFTQIIATIIGHAINILLFHTDS